MQILFFRYGFSKNIIEIDVQKKAIRKTERKKNGMNLRKYTDQTYLLHVIFIRFFFCHAFPIHGQWSQKMWPPLCSFACPFAYMKDNVYAWCWWAHVIKTGVAVLVNVRKKIHFFHVGFTHMQCAYACECLCNVFHIPFY